MDMVVPRAAREALVVRFGPGAGAWCDGLPRRVARLAERWELRPVRQLGGGTSRVIVCGLPGGGRTYLKLTPDPAVAAQEAEALRLWQGGGRTPALLAAAPHEGALLLAAVERPDGSPAPTLRDEAEARLADVAGLLTQIRGHRPGPSSALPTLAERVDFLFDLTRRRLGATPRPAVGPELVERCRRAALRLAEGEWSAVVHGDLHPGNVLDAGPKRGLVAIDPRPAVGDSDFDAIDWALSGATTPAAVQERVQRLADLVPGLAADRVSRWCEVTAVIMAVPRVARGADDRYTRLLVGMATLAAAS
ncbi:aminoglycoside phosphotransferase family protein [Streptantibioticus rubrisoli]|uniref:Aminoglycoside phosphotransferase family protein n=1 Tax=Streptantibioticus rubrisoli TaxID=1387313 RepID=A0ABT1P5F7_9ACTN|nr:aminoglycoside phosphotransferase family protein [Streptantibioticus rubrisoli]MCQ4040577.1 aminoglycoside phosphotransferase family protein [Streptantibioticus rubrisoli]